MPSVASQPPPHAQFAKSGYVKAPSRNDETMNAAYFQRSAAVPVTMVRAVSMKTIWNRNTTITPTSYVPWCISRKPLVPKMPTSLPNRWMVCSALSGAVPPRLATAPTPPIWIAKPISQ